MRDLRDLLRNSTPQRPMPVWRHVLAPLALLAAAIVFHGRLLLPGAWMPEGGGDNAGFLLPLFRYASTALRSGQLPLWNPHLYSGSPLAADIQVGMFYPPNGVSFLAIPRWTYGWMEVLSAAHILWAGLGLYFCARSWRAPPHRVSRPAALVGAVAFMFSDVFVTHFGNLNLIAVTAWLPWAFGAFHRALEAPDGRSAWRWTAAAGLCVGAAGLAGHPQPLAYIALALALYVVARIFGLVMSPVRRGSVVEGGAGASARSHPGSASAVRIVLATAAVAAIGLGVAAVALVPAWELLGWTRRAELSPSEASAYALNLSLLAGLLAPALFGRGMQRYWGPWPRVEVGYVGVVAILLAVIALTFWARERRARAGAVPFFAALAVIAFVIALGDATPLYDLVRTVVPGLAGMRAPARFVLVADFALAMLAAFGMDAIARDARHGLWRGSVAAVALAVAGLVLVSTPGVLEAARLLRAAGPAVEVVRQSQEAVAFGAATLFVATLVVLARARGRLGGAPASVALGMLVFAELAVTGAGLDWIDWDPAANLDPPAMAFLEADPGLYRIEVRPEAWGWWSPSAATVHDEQDVGGVYNPLALADYQLYWEGLTDRETPLYDFLNAKYVVAPKDFALPWDRFTPVFDDDEHLAVFLNTAAAPRAALVHRAHAAPDHDEAWSILRGEGFDTASEVVVEGGRPLDGAAPPGALAEVTGYRAGAVDVRTESETEAYLVLADVFYPGWRATVDGEPAALLRANYAFRAVLVPPGSHEVAFRFAPMSVAVGGAVSLLTLLAIALVTVLVRRSAPESPRRSAA